MPNLAGLERAVELKNAGVLTEAEFGAIRKKLFALSHPESRRIDRWVIAFIALLLIVPMMFKFAEEMRSLSPFVAALLPSSPSLSTATQPEPLSTRISSQLEVESKEASQSTDALLQVGLLTISLGKKGIHLRCANGKEWSYSRMGILHGLYAVSDIHRPIKISDWMPDEDGANPQLTELRELAERISTRGEGSIPQISFFSSKPTTIAILEASAGNAGGSFDYHFIDSQSCSATDLTTASDVSIKWLKGADYPPHIQNSFPVQLIRDEVFEVALGALKYDRSTNSYEEASNSHIKVQLDQIVLSGVDVRIFAELQEQQATQTAEQKDATKKVLRWSFYVNCLGNGERLHRLLNDLPRARAQVLGNFLRQTSGFCPVPETAVLQAQEDE